MTDREQQQNYERELGGIHVELKNIATAQEIMFQKLDVIHAQGCSVGRENKRRLDEIKAQPVRAWGIAAAIATLLNVVIAWFQLHFGGN